MFVLQRDGCKAVVDPTDAQLLQHLRRLKVCGRSQFLVLSTIEGDWLQVAGGTLCSIVERYDAESRVLWRAHRSKSLSLFRDVRMFGLHGYERVIEPDEILRMAETEEIALAFRAGTDVTSLFQWRTVHFGEAAARAFGFGDLAC